MIYFDSAATTFQKPPAVAAAVWDALATMSSPGRGSYAAAARAAGHALLFVLCSLPSGVLRLELLHEFHQLLHAFYWHSIVNAGSHTTYAAMSF